MRERTKDVQDNLQFQLSLLNLFAANRASDEAPRREADKLEAILSKIGDGQ